MLFRLLFVDSGSVGVSKEPVRPVPARWTLDKYRPSALFMRVSETAPDDTRDALIREENFITVKLQRPAAGGAADQVTGLATTVTGISAAVTVSSCRALLSQLGGAAPAPAPAAQPVSNPPAVALRLCICDLYGSVIVCTMQFNLSNCQFYFCLFVLFTEISVTVFSRAAVQC